MASSLRSWCAKPRNSKHRRSALSESIKLNNTGWRQWWTRCLCLMSIWEGRKEENERNEETYCCGCLAKLWGRENKNGWENPPGVMADWPAMWASRWGGQASLAQKCILVTSKHAFTPPLQDILGKYIIISLFDIDESSWILRRFCTDEDPHRAEALSNPVKDFPWRPLELGSATLTYLLCTSHFVLTVCT